MKGIPAINGMVVAAAIYLALSAAIREFEEEGRGPGSGRGFGTSGGSGGLFGEEGAEGFGGFGFGSEGGGVWG